jgi:pentapeptide MXKDX repeat protein
VWASQLCCGAHLATLAEDSDNNTSTTVHPDHPLGGDKFRGGRDHGIFWRCRGNNAAGATVMGEAAQAAFNPVSEDDQPMTISSRIALGASAAFLSLSLALAPAAFAQDKMGKDDGMKKESMSKDGMKGDGMKHDTMSKDGMKKSDGMMKDGMKKDDGMKKN